MKSAIFDDNLYRIHVPYRKHLTLENKLVRSGIEYWVDFEMHVPGSHLFTLGFYFNKNDANAIQTLLKKHSIQATDHLKTPSRFQQSHSFFILYIMSLITLLITGLLTLSYL